MKLPRYFGLAVVVFTLVMAAVGILQDGRAEDRLVPNKSVNEFTTLTATSVASGDYVLVYDASAKDWKRVDAGTYWAAVAGFTGSATELNTLDLANAVGLGYAEVSKALVVGSTGNVTFTSGTQTFYDLASTTLSLAGANVTHKLNDSAVTFSSSAGGPNASTMRSHKVTVEVSTLNSTYTVLPALSGLKYYIQHIDAVANGAVGTCTDILLEATGQGQTIATIAAPSIGNGDMINFNSAATLLGPTGQPVDFTSAKALGSVANTALALNPTGNCATATQITFVIWYFVAP